MRTRRGSSSLTLLKVVAIAIAIPLPPFFFAINFRSLRMFQLFIYLPYEEATCITLKGNAQLLGVP